jgi:high-affinity iron transporter
MMNVLMLVLGCGESRPADGDVAPGTHGHGDGDHVDGENGHHDDMAEHMAAMAATRDRLRTRLGDAYEVAPVGLDRADPAHGREVYEASCAVCHGKAGKGDGPGGSGLTPPPADFTDPVHAGYYSDAGRIEIIHTGVPGTGMAGWDGRLDAKDILDVYAYVRTLRGD